MTPAETAQLIVGEARRLGFHRVGIAPVDTPTRYRAYRAWLAAGRAGSMTYLSAPHQLTARRDVRALARDARTVVVVALAYAHRGGDEGVGAPTRGLVARYARGLDYHHVVRAKLAALADAVAAGLGRPVAARPCVDSAPVLERDFAEAAGLGFVAKNTMLIAPGLGSYVVLGELLLDIDAAPTPAPARAPGCGECRACLDACPTGAFVDAYVLDARRCISYLTIEHRGVIDRRLRAAVGSMVFGCDVCQQVCPYNAAAPDRAEPAPALAPRTGDSGALDLPRLLGLGANQLRKLVDGTALRRASRRQLLRNACVALGNALAADGADDTARAALVHALADRDPVVRGHAAWALGRAGARAELADARARETDPYVLAEISAALRPGPGAASARAEPPPRSDRR